MTTPEKAPATLVYATCYCCVQTVTDDTVSRENARLAGVSNGWRGYYAPLPNVTAADVVADRFLSIDWATIDGVPVQACRDCLASLSTAPRAYKPPKRKTAVERLYDRRRAGRAPWPFRWTHTGPDGTVLATIAPVS